MNYIEKTRSEGEEILSLFNINHFMYWNAYFLILMSFGLFIAGIVAPFEEQMLNLLFFAAGFLAMFSGVFMYLSLSSIHMGITNKRVVIKRGILAIVTDEIRLQAIETVDVNQSIIGRMMGYGTVKITGKGDAVVLYENVDNPLEIKRSIASVVSKYGDLARK